MAFRTGYENLPAAISDAFKTYWGRKEGQEGRKHELEMMREEIKARKDLSAQEKKDALDRLELEWGETGYRSRVAKEEAGYAESLKRIPSTVIHKGGTTAGGTMYGDIAIAVDTAISEMLPILIGAENFDDFLDKSQGRAFFTDRLDKDQFKFLQQNGIAAEQYLKKNITQYQISRFSTDKTQQKEATVFLKDLGYLDPVDWTDFYGMLKEQEEIKAEKAKIKEERIEKYKESEKKIYGGKKEDRSLMDIQGYFPLMP